MTLLPGPGVDATTDFDPANPKNLTSVGFSPVASNYNGWLYPGQTLDTICIALASPADWTRMTLYWGGSFVTTDIKYDKNALPVVPEPSSLLLLGFGILTLGILSRRKLLS